MLTGIFILLQSLENFESDLIVQDRPRMQQLPRCRALYDCSADNEDELSFQEGDIIIITNMSTEDENWMEGCLERNPSSRGMFPISFVHMLSEG